MRSTRLLLLGAIAAGMLVPVTLPVPVLRALVTERFHVSEFWTSLFMSINMVAAFVVAPAAGAISDRIGRRKAILVGALAVDGALLLALSLRMSFPAFLALRFAEGASHITALSLLLATAADGAGPAARGRTMGTLGAGMMFGTATGAAIGGFLGQSDPLLPLRAGALLSWLVGACAWFVLPDVPAASHRPALREIVGVVAADRSLLVPLGFAFIDRFTVGFYTTTFSLYLTRIHEVPRRDIGVLLALFLYPFALLSYPCGRLCESRSRTLLLCGGSVLYGLGTASLGWWPAEHLGWLMVGLGLASAVMFAPSLILATDLADRRTKATALGAFNAAGSLGFLVGPLAGGFISQSVERWTSSWLAGYRAAFIVAGASEVLCVLVGLPFLLRLVRSGRTT